MLYYLTKLFLSAGIIVIVSEVAKRTSLLGALIASLPLVSLLSLTWLYIDTGDLQTVNRLSRDILWLVIPSLIFFICLPMLSPRLGYWWALILSSTATAAAYALTLWILQQTQPTPPA